MSEREYDHIHDEGVDESNCPKCIVRSKARPWKSWHRSLLIRHPLTGSPLWLFHFSLSRRRVGDRRN